MNKFLTYLILLIVATAVAGCGEEDMENNEIIETLSSKTENEFYGEWIMENKSLYDSVLIFRKEIIGIPTKSGTKKLRPMLHFSIC